MENGQKYGAVIAVVSSLIAVEWYGLRQGCEVLSASEVQQVAWHTARATLRRLISVQNQHAS